MQEIRDDAARQQTAGAAPGVAVVTADRVLQLDLCGAVAEVLGDADLRTFASAAEALAALPLLARLDLVLLDAPGPATRPAEAAAHAELARRALERGARLISLGEEGPVPDLRLHLPFTTAMVHRLIGGLISS